MKSNFLLCGLAGWGFECFFTGLHSIFRRKQTLPCSTSLWMFGIYGLGCLIKPLYNIIRRIPIILRGSIYTILIFFTEFASGSLLRKMRVCPWDYSKARYNIKGLIRLDYAPLWFLVGLIYEKILCTDK